MFEGKKEMQKTVATLKQDVAAVQAEITALAKEQNALRTRANVVDRRLDGAGYDNEALANDVLGHQQVLEAHNGVLGTHASAISEINAERTDFARGIKDHTVLLSIHSNAISGQREDLDALQKQVNELTEAALCGPGQEALNEVVADIDEIDVAVDEHEDALEELHGHLTAVAADAQEAIQVLRMDSDALELRVALLETNERASAAADPSTEVRMLNENVAALCTKVGDLAAGAAKLSSRQDALRDMVLRHMAHTAERVDDLLGLMYGLTKAMQDLDARTTPVVSKATPAETKKTPAAAAKKWRKYHADDEGEAK